ncbi:MAG: hypothetical protein J5950_01875 [Clostridia bacterium]|nr:hypothetical protein [Clostridia bacterium]
MAQSTKNGTKKESGKTKAKKLAIRVICLVLAVSMVITTLYFVITYLINAFK